MPVVLTPYIYTDIDNEYLENQREIVATYEFWAKRAISILTTLYTRRELVSDATLERAEQELIRLEDEARKLIELEDRSIALAERARANDLLIEGRKPSDILDNHSSNRRSWLSVSNMVNGALLSQANEIEYLENKRKIASYVGNLGKAAGPIYDIYQIIDELSNGNEYKAISNTFSAALTVVVTAITAAPIAAISAPAAVAVGFGVGISVALLSAELEEYLIKYDALGFDELKPDPNINEAGLLKLGDARDLMNAIDSDLSEDNFIRILDAFGAPGEQIDNFFSYIRDYIKNAELFESERYLATSIREALSESEFDSYSVIDLTTLDAGTIANYARRNDDLGRSVRYALEHKSPFATYVASGTSAEASNYSLLNYSDDYLQDKALMLAAYLDAQINESVSNGVDGSPVFSADLDGENLFSIKDHSGENNFEVTNNTGLSSLFFSDETNVIFGGDANDVFYASSPHFFSQGADRVKIYSGAGRDTLKGGSGDDYLEGGSGNDIYEFDYDSGRDIVFDYGSSSEVNELWVTHSENGSLERVTQLTRVADQRNVYMEVDEDGTPLNNTRYIAFETLNSSDQIIRNLRIAIDGGKGGNIIIQDWKGNDNVFGIQLKDPLLPEEPEQGSNVHIVNVSDGGYSLDEELSYNTVNRDDYFPIGSIRYYGFSGGSENDRLVGGRYPDALYGGEGDDYIDVGDAEILVQPDDAHNIATGNLGDDHILGGDDRDYLWGNASVQAWDNYDDPDARELRDYYVPELATSSDYINGAGGDDLLSGAEGNDVLLGGEGNDHLYGGEGFDILTGGEGSDAIFGDSDVELRYVSRFDPDFDPESNSNALDSVWVLADNDEDMADIINGGDGRDHLFGELGSDIVRGGAGDDFVMGDRFAGNPTRDHFPEDRLQKYIALNGQYHADDELFGEEGDDEIWGNGGNDYLNGGAGDDFLIGDDAFVSYDNGNTYEDGLNGQYHGKDELLGGVGNDYLIGGGDNDLLDGGQGNDTLYGDINSGASLGNSFHGDDILYGRGGQDSLYGNDGADRLFGGNGDDDLDGGSDNDYLAGESGNDALFGDEGNDVLFGGEGADSLNGGAGNDLYIFNIGDTPLNSSSGLLDGILDSEGSNSIVINGASFDHLQLTNAANGLGLQYSDNDALIFANGSFGSFSRFIINGIEYSQSSLLTTLADLNALGNEGNDVINQDAGDDFAFGGDGRDSISTGDGDDVIIGGRGDDILYGGSGNDIYHYDRGDGMDTIDDTNGDNAIQFGREIVRSRVLIRRGFLRDAIEIYEDSPDPYHLARVYGVFDNSGAIENGGSLTIRFDNGTEWQQNELQARAILPSDGDDVIRAFDEAETISGALGDDRIYGEGGDDTLNGDQGNDELYGGLGDDVSNGGEGNDYLHDLDGSNTLRGGAGDDVITAGAAAGQTNTILYGRDDERLAIAANTHPSIFTGTTVLRFLDGLTSQDLELKRSYLNLDISIPSTGGFIRVDNFFADETGSTATIQRIEFDQDNSVLTSSDLHALLLDSTDNADAIIGTAGIDAISGLGGNDRISGGDSGDVLSGNAGDDRLLGQNGDDLLLGGGGQDTLLGGIGSDTLEGDAGSDSLFGGVGNDTLSGGQGNDTLNGQEGDDILIGGAGDDILQGHGGNNRYEGGAGNDRITTTFFENGTAAAGADDVFYFDTGFGQDTIINRTDSSIDTVEFGPGIAAADITAGRLGDDLILAHNGTPDFVRVQGFYTDTSALTIDEVRFTDGTVWASTDLLAASVNTAPTLTPQVTWDVPVITVGEAFNFTVPTNSFSDAEGDTLTFALRPGFASTLPDWLAFDAATGTFSGTPTAADAGQSTIIVEANDGRGGLVSRGFSLQVNALNEAPEALNDVASTAADTAIVIDAATLLANDTDSDGDVLSILSVSDSVNGQAQWDAQSQTVTFTPNAGYTGAASFDYTVEDGNGNTDKTLVMVTVGINGSWYIATDSDQFYGFSESELNNPWIDGVSGDDIFYGTNAEIVVGGEGSDLIWVGHSEDTFVVGGPNASATERDDIQTGNGNDTIRGSGNAGGGNDRYLFGLGDGHIAIAFYRGEVNRLEFLDSVNPSDVAVRRGNGVSDYDLYLEIDSHNSVQVSQYFNPGLNSSANAAFAAYGASLPIYFADGTEWNYETVNALVDGLSIDGNTLPEAADDVGSTVEDTAVTFTVAELLANDSDADTADALNIIAVTNAVNGSVALDVVLQTITFIPNADYFGPASFDYTLDDGNGGSDTATVNIAVTEAPNRIPEVTLSLTDVVAQEDSVFTFAIPANTFTDADGDTLTLSATLTDGNPLPTWLNFDAATGTFSGTPINADVGLLSVTVIADDGRGGSVSDSFDLNINNVNDAPVAQDDSGVTVEDTALVINVSDLLANDSDIDSGDTLMLTAVANAVNGTVVFDAITQTITFTPDVGYFGPASFDYTLSDGNGGSAVASVNLSVTEDTTALNLIEGTASNDTLNGTTGNDLIIGGVGNDDLSGNDGNDTFVVEGNNQGIDQIFGDAGFDTLLGGSGDDVMTLGNIAGVESIDGLTGSNYIQGTSNGNHLDFSDSVITNIELISGEAGNDTIRGSLSDDRIAGGADNDNLFGGAGDDTFIYSGSSEGIDQVFGDAGTDTLLGSDGDDVIGLARINGVEHIDGGAGVNTIVGSNGGDNLDFTDSTMINIDEINGGKGNDTIRGSLNDDHITGGANNDNLFGGAGNDTFTYSGTAEGVDQVFGDAGTDTLLGSDGDDVIGLARINGVEHIDGGAGVNTIAGSNGGDNLDFTGATMLNITSIDGGAGNDTVRGSLNADVINGGEGNDRLWGFEGDDVFLGGEGVDQLYGGVGNDTYIFGVGDGVDIVGEVDTANDIDQVIFEGASSDDLWFAQNGSDLDIHRIGTDDKVSIDNWFTPSGAQIEEIHVDGEVLYSTAVEQLVSAMAAYDAPSGAGAIVPQETRDQLQTVIAESWQMG